MIVALYDSTTSVVRADQQGCAKRLFERTTFCYIWVDFLKFEWTMLSASGVTTAVGGHSKIKFDIPANWL